MKSIACFLLLSSLISLSLLTFAYRDFSLILSMLFTHVFLGLPLGTLLLIKKIHWPSKRKYEKKTDQECDLVNKFNINSY